ncbi:MAG: hypothetical protein IAE78_01850 [Myxococcus sp.]|nr:hypothetical protein [Myxococcus sp.]
MSHRYQTTLLLLLLLPVCWLLAACGRPQPQQRCEACPDGLVCDSASGQCVAPASADGGCTSKAACAAPTPLCAPDGRCVACLSNADCPQGSCDMRAGLCVAAAAESCGALSSFIDVSSAALRLRGSTASAANDAHLSCAIPGSPGPDVLFGLRVPQRRRVTATVRPLDPVSGFQPVIGLRTECSVASTEAACGFTMLGGDRATLVAELNPGSFFVWVDSETQTGGEFELELGFDDAPNLDSCSAPSLLRGGSAIDVSGETLGLIDDVAASCGGAGAPDAVYRLTVDVPRRARLEAVGLSGFKPTLSVRRACADAQSEIACAPALTSSTSVIELPSLEPGDYAVLVDGPASGAPAGRYRLRITLSEPVPPPSNDTCSTALELMPSGGASTVSLQGDTTLAKNDAVGCDGTGPDLVYTLQLPAAARVRAQVTPLAGSRLQPALYLRRENQCESEVVREQLFCTAAGQGGFPALLEVPRLEAGRWFLFVDGKARTAGAFDLTLELSPPPAPPQNDACSTATVLPLASGPVFLPNETTVGASPHASTCGDTPGAADVAYSFTLTSRQSVSFDARALPGSRLLPVLTLKPAGVCAVSALLPLGTCAFSDLQVPDRAVAVVPALNPGTYTLWLSGDLATQGPFSLRVSPGPPLNPPPNDGCGSSGSLIALNVGATASGDTRAAGNSTEGRCGFPLGANGELGGDVLYTFQVAALTPSLSITVQPDPVSGSLMRPVIYVRGGAAANNQCTYAGANLGCQAAPDFGAPVTLTLTNVPPGVYSLWVDGAGLSAGAFSLSIR